MDVCRWQKREPLPSSLLCAHRVTNGGTHILSNSVTDGANKSANKRTYIVTHNVQSHTFANHIQSDKRTYREPDDLFDRARLRSVL